MDVRYKNGGRAVSRITRKNQDLAIEIMQEAKGGSQKDWIYCLWKIDALPDPARSEIIWWLSRMDAYLKGELT